MSPFQMAVVIVCIGLSAALLVRFVVEIIRRIRITREPWEECYY